VHILSHSRGDSESPRECDKTDNSIIG
jgi:hypothetical protein